MHWVSRQTVACSGFAFEQVRQAADSVRQLLLRRNISTPQRPGLAFGLRHCQVPETLRVVSSTVRAVRGPLSFLARSIRQAAEASRFACDGLRQVAGNLLSEGAEVEIARRASYRGTAAARVARAVCEAMVLSAESDRAAGLALGSNVGAGPVEDAIGIVSEAERLAGKGARGTGASASDRGGAEARHQGSSRMEKARTGRAFR